MPGFLEHHPGFLFVGATLLPLLSFVGILIAFAVKTYFRTSPEGSTGETIYKAFGGPNPSPIPAYIATGAIGLACVLSVWGFVLYATGHAALEGEEVLLEQQLHGSHGHGHEHEHEAGDKKGEDGSKEKEARLAELRGMWAGQLRWASVGVGDNERTPG